MKARRACHLGDDAADVSVEACPEAAGAEVLKSQIKHMVGK
jgi:hypothetical protein